MRNFPDLIEAFMQYMEASDASKLYQRWSMMSIVASALERKVWLMQNHDVGWYPNLYVFLVGPPGSGKSTVAETATSILRELDGIDFIPQDLNEAVLYNVLRSVGIKKKFNFNGESYPHSAATLFSSEAADSFKEQYKGGSIIGKLVSFYNGGSLGWSLKHGESRATKSDGSVTIVNPCINMLACSTPTWLTDKCITKTDAQGGFGSRILIVASFDELRTRSEWESPSTVRDMVLRRKIVEDLASIHKMQGAYQTSACFKARYTKCVEEYEAQKAHMLRMGIADTYHQRKLTHLCKLSMILAAARRDRLVIEGQDLDTAWNMLAEIEPTMGEILRDLDISQDAKNRREIMNYIRRRQLTKVTQSQLLADMPKMNYRDLLSALESLVTIGKLAREQHSSIRIIYTVIEY